MFALRPTKEGKSEGQTILLTRKRHGGFGRLWSYVLLLLTRLVGAYFAKGDTRIFETIRFNLRTPIKADSSIVEFIRHAERQKTVDWGLAAEEQTGADSARLKAVPNVRATSYREREAK
jgi:hypothetical protein